MHILFQPEQDEMSITCMHEEIHIIIENHNQDFYTVVLDVEMANTLIRRILELVWQLEHISDVASISESI